tara:strand:- start:10411 stop:11373 length:963 start_codon:yes stop_codon:yes gene_type:complete
MCSQDAGDVWDVIESNILKSESILTLSNHQTTSLRFLGPFLQGQRLYVPPVAKLKDLITQKEIIEVIKQNERIYQGVRGRIYDEGCKYTNAKAPVKSKKKSQVPKKIGQNLGFPTMNPSSPKEKMFNEALNTLDKLYSSDRWNDIIMVNVFVMDASFNPFARIRPFCLTNAMAETLFESIVLKSEDDSSASRKKISGLKAHNFSITRKGKGLETKYDIIMDDEPTKMENDHIQKLFSTGLLDLTKVVHSSNKEFSVNREHFVFKVNEQYRMDEELTQALTNERHKFIEEDHLDAVDNNINKVPDDAFDTDFTDSIGAIEF